LVDYRPDRDILFVAVKDDLDCKWAVAAPRHQSNCTVDNKAWQKNEQGQCVMKDYGAQIIIEPNIHFAALSSTQVSFEFISILIYAVGPPLVIQVIACLGNLQRNN
jgi:hypothetical protein